MNSCRLTWTKKTLKRAFCGAAILVAAACSEPTESKVATPSISSPAEIRGQQGSGPTWTKSVLGALVGLQASIARDISDNGVVVGESTSPGQLPFYWSQTGGMKQLPMPSNAIKGVARGISDNGAFATGQVELVDGRKIPVRWRWLVGGGISVALVGCNSARGFSGTGHAVNNAGTVVGETSGAAWSWALGGLCSAFVYAEGEIMKSAHDINDLGTIVGWGWPQVRGFITTPWSSAQLQPIPGLNPESIADAVDDANTVAGRSINGGNGIASAVYWSPAQGPGPATAIGPATSGDWHFVSLSDKGRYVWPVMTNGSMTGMSRKGTTTWALSIWPHGVNACGDIVGSENGLAVLMKKVVCD